MFLILYFINSNSVEWDTALGDFKLSHVTWLSSSSEYVSRHLGQLTWSICQKPHITDNVLDQMDHLAIPKHKRLEILPSVPGGMYAKAVISTPNMSPVECDGSVASSSDASYCASHNYAIGLSTNTEITSQFGLPSFISKLRPCTIAEDMKLRIANS
uniref:Uncharacterized protein n=1 Tax=Glossina palpalis gambiensis TaxID=67801 RepID=A0A1B0BTR7_9MUSC